MSKEQQHFFWLTVSAVHKARKTRPELAIIVRPDPTRSSNLKARPDPSSNLENPTRPGLDKSRLDNISNNNCSSVTSHCKHLRATFCISLPSGKLLKFFACCPRTDGRTSGNPSRSDHDSKFPSQHFNCGSGPT